MAAISGTLQRATAGAFELQVPFQMPWSSMPFPKGGLRHWHRSKQLSAQDQNLEPTPYSTAATQTGWGGGCNYCNQCKGKACQEGFRLHLGQGCFKS